MSSIFNPNYVQTTYKENKSDYPKKLVNYIIKKYNIKEGAKILDIGCGDGVITKCFIELLLKFSPIKTNVPLSVI